MLNRVTLIGHVGVDPDVKHLESGVSVARFTLATNESYTDKSGKKVTNTEWHNIVVWRGLSEVVEKYVKKGDPLYVEGKLHHSTYEDKQGNKQYRTDIICDNLRMLGGKDRKENQDTPQPAPQGNSNIPEPSDDLPF